jgi:hypothetical protein
MLGRLAHQYKGSSEVGGDHPIEDFQIAVGDRPHRHDAGAVHHDIDRAEGLQRVPEEALDIGGVTASSALAALPA